MTPIPDADLCLRDVPAVGASWDDISGFALTIDGYERPDCAEIANARRCGTLRDARTCLFFEQRRWRHFGCEPDESAMAYIRGLVEIIRHHVHDPVQTRMAFSTFVRSVGDDLVACDSDCAGVAHDADAGVLPRCMVLENPESDGAGCLVVGLNPGRAPASERDFYLEHGCSYDSVLEFWNLNSGRIRYYELLRSLVCAAGIDGPVLWTELAKCESAVGESTMPSIQTLRRCAGRYLQRELSVSPMEWPVFAVGLDAFRALAFLTPDRAVIGVPHPTGSRGQFARLLEGGSVQPKVRDAVRRVLSSPEPMALWLAAPGA